MRPTIFNRHPFGKNSIIEYGIWTEFFSKFLLNRVVYIEQEDFVSDGDTSVTVAAELLVLYAFYEIPAAEWFRISIFIPIPLRWIFVRWQAERAVICFKGGLSRHVGSDLNKNTIYMCWRGWRGSVGLRSRSDHSSGSQFAGAFLSKLLSFGLSLRLRNFAVRCRSPAFCIISPIDCGY